MTQTSLSGVWEIGSVPPAPFGAVDDVSAVSEWLPAAVPGDIRAALLASGRLLDPLYADNAAKTRWVDQRDWWYRRSFTGHDTDRSFIVFDGVDYLSAVYLNGHLLGLHEGMFSPQVYEVTGLLRGENILAVRIWGAHAYRKFVLDRKERLRRWLTQRLIGSDLFPDRLATLKCQMSFGWDFAPNLPTMGIWEDVWLRHCVAVRIASVFPRLAKVNSVATVDLQVELDAAQAGEGELIVDLEGANFVAPAQRFAFLTTYPPGGSRHHFSIPADQLRLWQPWDRGEPNLYRLKVSLRGDGEVLDTIEQCTGWRQVTLTAGYGEGEALGLTVNDARLFVRGANWVPADALYGRLRAADYEQLVGLAKEANINLLRVWGGGLREKRAFYDACDAAGIMIWQEFPFACAFLDHFPRSEEYLQLAQAETRAIVRGLRHHPSVVLWCGGNEFSPRRNGTLLRAIRQNVEAEDGSRPFRPASPCRGDHHNWRVWHGRANVRDYEKDDAILASEFGLQAAPAVESLRQFLPPDRALEPSALWEAHCAQLDKLRRYAAPFAPRTPEEFVAATQQAQAQGLQVAIEHFRRQKGRCTGVIFWQFNEPWGAISWSIVDYYRRPKLAYHKVREVFNPVLVSVAYPLRLYRPGDRWKGLIYVINDSPRQYANCRLELNYAGRPGYRRTIDVRADSMQMVNEISFVLNQVDWLQARLWQGDLLLAQNSYDLAYYDPDEISRCDAMRNWFTWRTLNW